MCDGGARPPCNPAPGRQRAWHVCCFTSPGISGRTPMKRAAWWLAMLSFLSGCGRETPATSTITVPAPRVVVGGTWHAPQLLADAGPAPADTCFAQGNSCLGPRPWVQAVPVVAGNTRGQSVAVFQRFEGGAFQVAAARSAPANGWGPPEPLLAEHGSLEPLVALDEQGRALVVWGHGGGLVPRYRGPGGGWRT